MWLALFLRSLQQISHGYSCHIFENIKELIVKMFITFHITLDHMLRRHDLLL